MDHFDYTIQEKQFDVSGECYDNVVDESHQKYGDELLIDLVRSRPYLYDKTHREYKNTTIKDNAWKEMSDILNITVSDCQTRWTRIRQRYSKERILREQETRSGAGKPTRSKWLLFENLNFLERHIVHRKSITNMSLSQSSTSMHQASKEINQDEHFRVENKVTLPQVTSQRSFSQNIPISSNNISTLELEQPWTPSLHHQPQLSDSVVKQVDVILAPTYIPDTQPALVLTPPPSQQSIALTRSTISSEQSTVSSIQRSDTPSERSATPSERSATPSERSATPSERSATSSPQQTTASFLHRSTSSFQQSVLSDSDTEMLSPPSACYVQNQKSMKKRKVEPIESAFSQINTTLSTMATQILSKNNATLDNNDSDVLIGKLVTAELKKTLEPRKSILKKKFMEILYSSDNL